jgi:hypothetical protein
MLRQKDLTSQYCGEFGSPDGNRIFTWFALPAEQCLTGATFVNDGELPSFVGIVRTRKTDSQALANTWLERQSAQFSRRSLT